jgi:hypothetical protein
MQEETLRQALATLLLGGEAHAPTKEVIQGFSADWAADRLAGAAHTGWELLEHLRIAQWDILEFATNPGHMSPAWPQGYWPESDAPADAREWDRSVRSFLDGLQKAQDIATDRSVDLFVAFPHGTGQTMLRELLLIADHNAYHLGQLLCLQRALETLKAA